MTNVMESETTRGRKDSGRTGMWATPKRTKLDSPGWGSIECLGENGLLFCRRQYMISLSSIVYENKLIPLNIKTDL